MLHSIHIPKSIQVHTNTYTNVPTAVSSTHPFFPSVKTSILHPSIPKFVTMMIFQAPLSSTALLIQWYHHYQHPEESLASIPQLTLPLFLLLLFSSQPSPSAGDCQGEASGGVSAAHPGCPTCGRIPHTRTACCVAPCRHTSG